MKLKLLTAVATAALIAAPSLATADDSGWYVRGNVGYGTHTDIDLKWDIFGEVESEGNVAGSLGVGYDFGNNWRLESDLAHLWTDLGQLNGNAQTFSKLGTTTAMLNAIYDFNSFGSWEPYIGAGVGIVRAQTTSVANSIGTLTNPSCISGIACSFKDSDTGLGFQLLAGLGYAINDKLTWDTQYRYQKYGNLDFDGTVAERVGAFRPGSMTMVDAGAHMLMTGFRYKFGPSTPPVMYTCWNGSSVMDLANCPAQPMVTCWDGSTVSSAAQCPAEPVRTQVCWDGSEVPVTSVCPERPSFTCRDGSIVFDSVANCPTMGTTVTELCANEFRQEIIYYEFDKGQSAETRNAISRILDTGAYCNVDNVRVVGHTDRSGPASYNLNLSKKRAKDARDELVRQGINSAIITSEGKGETEPFVPTADGVKEQLNRRTEVIIQLGSTGVIN